MKRSKSVHARGDNVEGTSHTLSREMSKTVSPRGVPLIQRLQKLLAYYILEAIRFCFVLFRINLNTTVRTRREMRPSTILGVHSQVQW